jgi:hypothetical protein
VEIVRYLLDIHNPNITPEISVDRVAQFFRRKRLFYMNVRYLSLRVNASVSPTRSDYADRVSLKRADDPLQFALNGAVVLLHLPAVKVSAVVLDEKFVIHAGVRHPGLIGRSPPKHIGH